jgi:alpha-tubulin suppressor-like RCC1 family protein
MKHLRRLLALGALLFTAACDGDPPARPPASAEPLGDGQMATAGTPLAEAVGVRVLDADGEPLRNVPVRFAVAAGAGSLDADSVRTGRDGAAIVRWTLGTQLGAEGGLMRVTASVPAVGDVVLTARARPGAVATLSIGVPPEADTLGVGRTGTLAADVRDAYGNAVTDRRPAWEALDPAVAIVNETGVVTGVSLGTARIRARLDGGDDTVAVTVSRTAGGGWAQLDAGQYHTCGVWSDGAAYCWGLNDFGQLGDGGATGRDVPGRVALPAGTRVRQVRAALGPLSCALTDAGAAWCWGQNGGGATPSPAALPAGVTFTDLAPGELNLCGLTSTGEAWCRGSNAFGQMGDGTRTNSPDAFTRVQAPAGTRFRRLAVSSRAACGVTEDGRVLCWGSNFNGELGTGGAAGTDALVPVPAATQAGTRFTAIGAGEYHFCAAAEDGSAWCWGENSDGQAGNGAAGGEVRTPARVQAPAGTAFVEVSGGASHSCGSTAAGDVYCWGFNDDGEVGDGTTAARPVPARALMPAGVRADVATAGTYHACALTLVGEAFCWGWNPDGALGNGTTSFDPTTEPQRVRFPAAAPASFRAQSAGAAARMRDARETRSAGNRPR